MARDGSAVGVLVASDRAIVPPTPTFGQPAGLQRWLARHWLDLVLVAPLFLYVIFFMLVPVAQSIYLSFTLEGAGQPTFDNYRTVINRSQFRDAFVNTLGISVIGVAMEMTVGITIALMLARQFRGRGLFRSVVLVPLGVPTIVAGAAMLYFIGFNGYLNEILLDLGIIDVPVYWQQSGLRGMFAIALADLWKTTPLVVLILLAGLESIPGDVYEAASVDGADGWRRFWDHTIPLLMPSITMALILRVIDAFRIFDIALVLAGQAIPVMSSFVYFDYQAGSINTAAAAAVILLLMILVFVVAYFLLVARRTEDVR
ncbi:MAG: permease component of ABC-type sugar transporter [Thermomicrobiales bacterium]|nr:permease component of ABC-type sugar transporter [Thermomicrobiales bacterium]